MEDSARPDPRPDLTIALRDLGAGRDRSRRDSPARDRDGLRAIAQGYLGARHASHTLQPTALVNEAFLKLFGAQALERIRDRSHFFALAARAMRQVLVDHARARKTAGAGAGEGVTIANVLAAGDASPDDLLDVDAALIELAQVDERQARLVELRFFAGLEVEPGRSGDGLVGLDRRARVARRARLRSADG